jgi:hypothetical protein
LSNDPSPLSIIALAFNITTGLMPLFVLDATGAPKDP